MVNAYSIPYAKGLFSAAFIQYFIYAMLYCLEGSRIKEIRETEKQKNESGHLRVSDNSAFSRANIRVPETEQKLQLEGGSDEEKDKTDNKAPIDPAEIELEEVKAEP